MSIKIFGVVVGCFKIKWSKCGLTIIMSSYPMKVIILRIVDDVEEQIAFLLKEWMKYSLADPKLA